MRKRYRAQNLYKTTLVDPIAAIWAGDWDTVFQIKVEDTPSTDLTEWFIMVDYNDVDKRDLIKFHNVSGTTFYYYRKDRDLLWNGSSAIRHDPGSFVQINVVYEYHKHLYENIDDFWYIEDFWTNNFKAYGGIIDTPWGQATISDTSFTDIADGTRYVFFDYADNTFKLLASTSWYYWVSVATVIIASWDISSITDTRPMVMPVRYDPDVFAIWDDGELKLINNTTISDATTASAGRVRLGTLTDHADQTAWAVVVQTSNLVKTPDWTPANDKNKVPILNASWRIDDFVSSHIKYPYIWTSTGSANAYVVAAISGFTAYTTWYPFTFTSNFANTAAATINIGGIWVKSIKTSDGYGLLPGMISSWMVCVLVYNGTDMVLLNPVYPSINKYNAVIWETISANNALRYWISWWETVSFSWDDSTINVWYIWFSTTYTSTWQWFSLSTWWMLSSITVSLKKVWTPTWTLTLKVSTAANGSSDISVSSNTISEASLTTSFTDQVFTFDGLYLPAGTYYFWIVDNRAPNSSNYSVSELNSAGGYAGWVAYRIDSTDSWTTSTYDHQFSIEMEWETTTKLYKTDARSSYTIWFVWFAAEWWNADDSIRVDYILSRSMSWLTPASDYYLSDTAWAISTSAWTNSRKVWLAMSATDLWINLFWT